MKTKKDSPGVYPPPPLFYVSIFISSILIQNYISLPFEIIHNAAAPYLSALFIASGIFMVFPALLTFLRSRNTLITILPAASLQTGGIYSISRNPMYAGLLFIYTGMGFLRGNLWTFILIPLVMFVVTRFVIINEEQYLERAFGQDYLNYKAKVRRWL